MDDSKTQKYKKILKDVKEVLNDRDLINEIMDKYEKESEKDGKYQVNREKRIKELLNKAGLKTEDDYKMYEEALKFSGTGYSVILERDIDEIFVNNYNNEWMKAWRGNMDIQVCLDFFAVITYITEYYTKDEKMIVVMNTFLTVRQMGEAEAYYRILPELELKSSNSTTIYVPNCRKDDRSKFLKSVQKDQISPNQIVVQVKDKDGFFVENYDMVDKWYRRIEELQDLSFTQFSKMFRSAWKVKEKPEGADHKSVDGKTDIITEENKFNFIMTSNVESKPKKLPPYFRLTYVNPGEPPFMRRRPFPAVLRFHKYKEENKPHNYYFSEMLLYLPHSDESEIFPYDEIACTRLYFNKNSKKLKP